MKSKNSLKGTPWGNSPVTKEELAEIKKQIEEDDDTSVSKELEDHLKETSSIGRRSYSYGDENQNDLMKLIDGCHED